ncbi:MAG TPA: DUF2189 domain-containing protein [Sphingomicrobium sp.]|jgi:uncharacterized membrane protein|nr:DUF2189 domain-containing protein [Sphingomicrobium sp.]
MAADRQADTKNEESAGFLPALRRLTLADPLRWLAAGARDFLRAPAIGLFFGSCFVAMGWALLAVFESAPAYVIGLSAGFLLVGPFLCMGLYYVSERLERGEQPRLIDAALAWRRKLDTLAIFGVVLLVLEMLWARASLVLFALTFEGTMPDFAGSLKRLVDPKNLDFILAWTALGGVFATIIFSVTVVSIPMILDRRTDAITAGLTSIRLVLDQPAVLLPWAAIIAILVVLAMLPGFAGLFVVGPVLGHASWHAYRASVEPPALSSG